MKLAVYSAHPYDCEYLSRANIAFGHELVFFEQSLNTDTVNLARGCPAVCIFVNDIADHAVLEKLSQQGIRLLVLRCTGYNNIDLPAAKQFGITIMRVGEYSPYAVAELAALLMLALNRKFPLALARVQKNNFSLDELMGFDLHGKTIGIIGAGKIGEAFCKITKGFGCDVIAYDIVHNVSFIESGGRFVSLATLAASADVISLHCSLTPDTKHLINSDFIAQCKKGVLIINTSRGAVIDTQAALNALQTDQVGGMALDVYEFETGLFFSDHSDLPVEDMLLAQLLSLPNIIITGHQGFLTKEAFAMICQTTLANVTAFENGESLANVVTA